MKKLISNTAWYTWRMKRFHVFIVIFSMLFSSMPILAGESMPIQTYNAPVELATLTPPPYSFSIPPAANLEEAIALLPQYVTITTNPPSAYDRLPISWQLCYYNVWGDFNPELWFDNTFDWLGTLPPGVTNPYAIRLEGSSSVFNVESVFAVYASVVRRTLNRLPLSNATTADDIMAAVEAVIEGTSITAEWNENPWNPYFEFRPATLARSGEIVARILLTQDDNSDVINMRRDFTHPIAEFYRFIRGAIDNLDVTNATTADDFYNAVERVLRGTGVEISWHEDFIRTDATPYANGTITGIMRLTAGTEYADFSVNREIPFLWRWGDALRYTRHRVSTLRTSNQTTLADIIAHMQTIVVSPHFFHSPEISWHGDFNLTPATETRNGRITATATLTLYGEPEPYVFIFDRAIPRSRIANEVFLEWDYGTLAAPRPDNLWPATRGAEGMILEDTCLAFYYVSYYQGERRAILGRAANMSARLAINVPNRAVTGGGGYSLADWIFHADDPYSPPQTVANVAGWVITLSTSGWENINFSARQAASGNGPGGFGFAYRIGTDGEWIRYGDGSWPLVSVRTDYPRDRVLGETFRNFQLPEAIANQPMVQIKLYIDGRVRLGGSGAVRPSEGNISINNIVFRGDRINGVDPTPVITINTHPANANVVCGEIEGELSVTASVTQGATLSYQWFTNTTASNTGGTAIPGANTATFAIPANLAQNSTNFFYVVISATGGAESVTSNVATVTVGFGTVPHTGIPNIAGMIAAMFVFLAVSTVSWGFVLRNKLRQNSA